MLTVERVKELDIVCGQEIVDFVRHVRLATLFHEDNVAEIRNMAARAGVPPAKFSKYVWLQTCIAELSSIFDDAPSPENVADHLEISWPAFEAYFMDRAEKLRYEVEDDFCQQSYAGRFLHSWEDEEDFIIDLQKDAGLQGD